MIEEEGRTLVFKSKDTKSLIEETRPSYLDFCEKRGFRPLNHINFTGEDSNRKVLIGNVEMKGHKDRTYGAFGNIESKAKFRKGNISGFYKLNRYKDR